MSNKWDELNLTERTNKVRAMESSIRSTGRQPNLDVCTKLCEWNIKPGSNEIQMYLDSFVSLEELQPKTSIPQPISLAGSLTEACKNAADENTRKENLARQSDIDSRRIPVSEPNNYNHYY